MTKLTWDDLIVDDISIDQFSEWFAPWGAFVVGRTAPAFMTKFGIWFLRRPEGHVDMLDVLSGSLTRASSNYDEFVREVNEQWWQEIFLFTELVLKLHDAGMIPSPGQCYALAPHPAMGGRNPLNGDAVDSQCVMLMDIPVWQSICAQTLGTIK